MIFPHRQHGITLLGFLIVLMVLGFFAFLGMRIGPAYLEYMNVVTAMKGVAAEPGAATWSMGQIRGALDKRLYINYVDQNHVGPRNFTLTRKNGINTLNVFYEVREDLLYNLDYVATFEKSIDLTSGGNYSP